MARVEITLNGRIYPIACEDGQEQRVYDIADYLETKLVEIQEVAGSVSDIHLMVMVSLVVADELFDTRYQTGAHRAAEKADETAIAMAVQQIAGRVENLALRLDRS
ncbi:MAG: cell division protein ZapA [Inquilinaceae bacterium]